jgi:glycerophosphoryl diester phosphodiesterase
MESTRPLIYGHRGASARAPENTLAAFRLAREQSADGIELDAKLTADGEIVVIHDQTVDRTTNGKGRVLDLSLEEIRRLDAGCSFSPVFRSEHIPTLEEVLEAVGRDLLVNIELTNYASLLDQLPEKVATLISRLGLEDRVIISSFSPINLVRFRRKLPGVRLGLLTMTGFSGKLARSFLGRWIPSDALHPHYSNTTPDLVNAWQRRGKQVNVWTVNQTEEMVRLANLRVDGIITDDPALARQVLTKA